MRPLLALRPCYDDATKYGYHWVEKLFTEIAQEKNFEVIELVKNECSEPPFSVKVLENNVILVTGVCHGNETTIVGQHHSVLMQKGDEVTGAIANNRVFSMLSCSAGKELLKWMVEEGAIATMGYDDIFYFCIGEFPNDLAKPFFDSHFAGERKLLEGGTIQEAFGERHSTFNRYLANPNIPEKIKPYLMSDRDCAVMYGDPEAKIVVAPKPPIEYVIKLRPKLKTYDVLLKVIDVRTEKPIEGARAGISNKKEFTGITNREGVVLFEDVEEGEYTYAVAHADYHAAIGKLKVPKEEG